MARIDWPHRETSLPEGVGRSLSRHVHCQYGQDDDEWTEIAVGGTSCTRHFAEASQPSCRLFATIAEVLNEIEHWRLGAVAHDWWRWRLLWSCSAVMQTNDAAKCVQRPEALRFTCWRVVGHWLYATSMHCSLHHLSARIASGAEPV
jgi:hypothetical protein